jgi:dTDP-glucose pyrophosphorylase
MSEFTTDRAVILARGLGTRMRRKDGVTNLDAAEEQIAETGVKAMIPIKRPFLDYILSILADAGFRRICLVIGPEHNELRRYYGRELKTKRLSIEFAVQQAALGTANAILAAESWAAGEPFLALNSDNYYPLAAVRELRATQAPAVALVEQSAMLAGSNIPPERIKSFAIARHLDGRLQQIVEKPSEDLLRSLGGRVHVSMNLWLFDKMIFDACRAIPRSPRGEYEIPDAVEWCLARNVHFNVRVFAAPVLDLSSRSDIAPVQQRLERVEVRL